MDRIVVSLMLFVSLATGCAHGPQREVQYLARHERAGILQLHGSLVSSTGRAHLVMTEHCEGRWRLLDDAEALELQASAAGKSQAGSTGPVALDDRHLAFACLRR